MEHSSAAVRMPQLKPGGCTADPRPKKGSTSLVNFNCTQHRQRGCARVCGAEVDACRTKTQLEVRWLSTKTVPC